MVSFDNEKLAKRVYGALWEKRLQYRDAAEQMGISTSTVCRIVTHRKRPDVDSLARILDWLGDDFKDFVKHDRPSRKQSPHDPQA
ncbi:helix-turn-helix domain-containing protein [Zavarzinella formosa]|uniref:helix-turn-helix domain-containing protein n=1 Tax=Zavarzinella formosa TaxID=360055 RepID=UPI00036A1373|nr:helix-turn-helix transcriptional regulator [Zavarzinella formosa]